MTTKLVTGSAGSAYVRVHYLDAVGDRVNTHTHVFDHLTLLAHGAARVTVEGQSKDFTAPALIGIVRNKYHEITALADKTVVACIICVPGNDKDVVLDDDQLPAGIKADFFGERKLP